MALRFVWAQGRLPWAGGRQSRARIQSGPFGSVIALVMTSLPTLLLLLSATACADGDPSPASDPTHEESPADLHVASASDQQGPFLNRLALASSPYLLQHATNPVDWHQWGEAAFALAQARDVPIFLSVGYAACHWCHVMAKESFSDPAVAAVLNEHFVAIKVDREERPDVDALYMDAVQRLNEGEGGWPASIWLTPDLVPFYAGTYFPPEASRGRPGFGDVLARLDELWRTDRPRVLRRAGAVHQSLIDQASAASGRDNPPDDAMSQALVHLRLAEDPEHGGWSNPKFPRAPILSLLLDAARAGDEASQELLVRTLDTYAWSALQDPVAGGFHRYTVDTAWRVPHYEKMLYDNAQLASAYADAARITGEPRFAEVARSTLAWMDAALWLPEGGYASSLDADADHQEGITYTWTPAQVRALLLEEEARVVIQRLRLSETEEYSPALDGPPDAALRASLDRLLLAREDRPQPARDGKRVVAWNGLALSALTRAVEVYPDALERARSLAALLIGAQRPDGTLPRTLEAHAPDGVVDDHAFVGVALLDLFEVDPDPRWLRGAAALGGVVGARFAQAEGGFTFAIPRPDLLAAQMDWDDGAEPSGLGQAVLLLQRLAAYGAPGIDEAQLEATLRRASPYLQGTASGLGFPSLVRAWDRVQRGSVEVIVIAAPGDPTSAAMRVAVEDLRRPGLVFGEAAPGALDEFGAFTGKVAGALGPRAYVCRARVCKAPVESVGALREALVQAQR